MKNLQKLANILLVAACLSPCYFGLYSQQAKGCYVFISLAFVAWSVSRYKDKVDESAWTEAEREDLVTAVGFFFFICWCMSISLPFVMFVKGGFHSCPFWGQFLLIFCLGMSALSLRGSRVD